ncbi:methyl-accepting chemotaxis protein [Pseudothauera nasutitermitis]|uniref:Methyl-accepting chemotaxis protein n=1 Tax=Pseudothauera nasutitermitis TaxID=2565930 RepID=A0A4S4AWN8_9RHOO|nr:methyl-accepting chemotaxis protein [Pseudothauera nasutitermitis]THF63685.1 methyl-accepting chemotaxis protein [Pseudothauera nasutitermitis]
MSIAKRLALLIILAVAGLVSMGLFGFQQMKGLNTKLEYANNQIIPKLEKISDIEAAFLGLRIQMLTFVMSSDAQRSTAEQRLGEARQTLDRNIREYETQVSSDEDRKYHETSKALVRDYLEVIELGVTETNAGRPDEAMRYSSRAAEIGGRLSANIGEHIAYGERVAARSTAEAAEAYDRAKIVSVLAVVGITIVVAGLGILLHRHVSSALKNMVDTFSHIEAKLDFTARQPVSGNDEVAQAAAAFNRLLDRLQKSFHEIIDNAEVVHSAANRVATASGQMSIASGEQSEAASSMAATVEEMTVSINHVADRAGETNQLSASSGELAQRGRDIIGETVSGINSIAETVRHASEQIATLEQQSERINSVVSVIKDVADQTNLLALNAAIEAARAGEQGRGFAVVADEVRKLAERTTQSTQEISTTITAMQAGAQAAVDGIHAVVERVDQGVSHARQASHAIDEIGGSSRRTVEMVGDITDAIREQSIASTSIAQQVEKIAQMSEENSAAVQSTADAADELATLARTLQQVVAQYRI